MADSLSLFGDTADEKITEINTIPYNDAGQTFARKLSKKIDGYKADLKDSDKIIVMGLDSWAPGESQSLITGSFPVLIFWKGLKDGIKIWHGIFWTLFKIRLITKRNILDILILRRLQG